MTADCTSLEADPQTGLLLQTRPAFGGNLMATIVCPDHRPQMATVRPKVFPAPVPDPDRPWSLVTENCPGGSRSFEWLGCLAAAEESDVGEADVLIAVGQGIGGTENIALAEQLAGEDLGEALLLPCNMLREQEEVFAGLAFQRTWPASQRKRWSRSTRIRTPRSGITRTFSFPATAALSFARRLIVLHNQRFSRILFQELRRLIPLLPLYRSGGCISCRIHWSSEAAQPA